MTWHPGDLPRGRGAVHLHLGPRMAELVLDSPEARNAVSPGMMVDLERAVLALEGYEGCALLIRGEGGRAFCAGGDLEAVQRWLTAPGAGDGMCGFMGDLLDRLAALPLVVIAAVEGAALGGGAELLTVADLVVAGAGARVGFVQARLGVSPGWGGGARLVRRVGPRAALRLLAFAPTLSAEAAAEAGLVDRVCADGHARAEALSMLEPLDLLPIAAVRGAVRVVRAAEPGVERATFGELWGGPDHLAALGRMGRAST